MRYRRGRQPQSERQGEEDAQAQDHLLESATATAQQTFPEDTVPGAARTRRTSRFARAHSDPGECHRHLYRPSMFAGGRRSFSYRVTSRIGRAGSGEGVRLVKNEILVHDTIGYSV